jgi:hypothetical protein
MTGVASRGKRRLRIPRRRRALVPPQSYQLAARALPSGPRKPGPGSERLGKPLTVRGPSCRERVQSKLCQHRPERSSRGPAGPGGGAVCSYGSLQPARPPSPHSPRPGTQARARATRSLTSLPPPTTWSGPAPRRLGAARQPAHTHMRATERAARIHERALRARGPCLARARRSGRSQDRRGSASCRRIVSRLPYISSRALGLGTRGWALWDKPHPRSAPSQQSTGGAGHTSWLCSSPLVYPL